MKVLLTSGAPYVPPRGGSTRANKAWLDYMAAKGHDCAVVAPAPPRDSGWKADQLERELGGQSIIWSDSGVFDGVRVHRAPNPLQAREALRERIKEVRPDWVLVSSEDAGQALLRTAQEEAPGRVVYLAHTPQMLPFGRDSLAPNTAGAQLVQAAAAIISISQYTARLAHEAAGKPAAVIHAPVYGAPALLSNSGPPYRVGMINPCAVKGISIFIELAKRFPGIEFLGLRSWGTRQSDMAAMLETPNVRVIDPVASIDSFYSQIGILLVPSLWAEGFGLVVVEAMLRGVPVLGCDYGGVPEAKLGTHYVLPVRPITNYRAEFDEHLLPIPEVPPQDLEPWTNALGEVLSSRTVYDRESAASRHAALGFVEKLDPGEFERFLGTLEQSPQSFRKEPPSLKAAGLSPERRALLARLARSKKTQ